MNALAMPWLAGMLAVCAAAAVVALLYLLKPPPSTVPVPSTLIWDRVLRASRPSAQRLRWWLSVLLALLIAMSVTAALVGLPGSLPAAGSSGLVLVIDDSPTMATRTSDGGTRLAHALARARDLMLARSPQSRIWLTDTMRLIAIPGFRSRADALAQLDALRVAHGQRPQIVLPDDSAGTETVIITDGVSIDSVPRGASIESVFESVENAGITAFALRSLPANPRRYMAYVEVLNASGTDKRIALTLSGLGAKRISRTLSVGAGLSGHELIDVSDFDVGPLRASIRMPGDGLAADDVAYAVLPAHRVIRVALVTNRNPFLEQVLQAQPRVRLTTIAPGRYVDSGDYDALVFDRFAPQAPPAAPALLFHPSRVDWLPAQRAQVGNLTTLSWNAADPLLENASLADLSVQRASVFDLHTRDGMQRVVASGSGGVPLIVARQDPRHWIALSFALEQSNFALQAAFPIFMSNALNWLVGEREFLARGLGPVEIPLADARILAADGSETASAATAHGRLFETQEAGLFTAVAAHERLPIAVNLLDRRITQVNNSALARYQPAARAAPARGLSGFATQFLLLGAALLLLLEWWSWNRRLTL